MKNADAFKRYKVQRKDNFLKYLFRISDFTKDNVTINNVDESLTILKRTVIDIRRCGFMNLPLK